MKIENAVVPTLPIQLNGTDYTVELPITAVRKAEQTANVSLKTIQDWLDIPPQAVCPVILAGLEKHHPELTEDERSAIQIAFAGESMTPEMFYEVRWELMTLNYPKYVAKVIEAGFKKKGTTSPNAPSGDAS